MTFANDTPADRDHDRRYRNDLRELRYQWYLGIARAHARLTPAELAALDQFRAANPESSDANWPGFEKFVAKKPGTSIALIHTIRRRA